MIKQFLAVSIGKTFGLVVVTGDDDYTGVFARRYKITLIGFDGVKALFQVSSSDMTPSGMLRGDSDKTHGQFSIDFTKSKLDEQDLIMSLLTRAAKTKDSSFFARYRGNLEFRVHLPR